MKITKAQALLYALLLGTSVQAVPGHAKTTAIFIGLLAALAGLMFGLDIGVISGATQFIQSDFKVGDQTIEWIVSSMMFGAALGALVSGWLSVHLERRRTLLPCCSSSGRCCAALHPHRRS